MRIITEEMLSAFADWLTEKEMASGSIQNYLRYVRAFAAFAGAREADHELTVSWRASLQAEGNQAATVNAKLVGLNAFFRFAGWEACRVRLLRVQKRAFRSENRDLSKKEYERLRDTAWTQGRTRLALLIEAIGATGVRVSETRYFTVEAVKRGRTEISLKRKIRTILIPKSLRRKLLRYAEKTKIASGPIFVTGGGKPMGRRQIWAELKSLCKAAGVEPGKVFPHNLRHMFAREFYARTRDVVKLADLLGHSSVETTRVYLISTGAELAELLERLGLVS